MTLRASNPTGRDPVARRRARHALVLAALALALALAGIGGNAIAADDNNPYQLAQMQQQIEALQMSAAGQADAIDALTSELDSQADMIDTLTDESVNDCLVYSDRHYFREQINGHGRRWRFPLVGWNMANRACRPGGKVWTPQRRVSR